MGNYTICEHNRVMCACREGKRTPEQYQFERGVNHAGYGWAPTPPYEPNLKAAYREGYEFGEEEIKRNHNHA